MTEPPGPVCHQATSSSVTDLNTERAAVLVNGPLPAAAPIWMLGRWRRSFERRKCHEPGLNDGGNKGVAPLRYPQVPWGLLGQQRLG